MLDALNMHTSCGSSISSIKPLRWTFDRITAYGRRLLPFRAALLCTILAATWVPSVSAAPLDDAAEHYRRYLIEDIERALIGARVLRERIGAGDLEGAKRAWIEARIGWERSEVFTSGFVPELDQQIDAWPNAINGFHGIEAKLFGANRIDVVEETDSLIVHLADLHAQIYTGVLADLRRNDLAYVPHITLGMFANNKSEFPQALDEAERLDMNYSCLVDRLHLLKINDQRTRILWSREFLVT